MQTTRVHLKQQIRQAERTAVDHNYCVHFAIMSYPISLDKVLEANDICDGFLAVPDLILVARHFAFLSDLEITTIACHLERICSIG